MKLSIKERIQIDNTVAQMSGSFEEQIFIEGLRDDIKLSESEVKKSGLHTVQGQIIWNKDIEKDIEMSKERLDVIKKGVLNQAGKGILPILVESDFFSNIKLVKADKKILTDLVDKMSEEGNINQGNLSICKKIKNL